MRAAAARGLFIRFAEIREGKSRPQIPPRIHDRLRLIRMLAFRAADNADFQDAEVRFVIHPTLVMPTYSGRFERALTTYLGKLQQGLASAPATFAAHENVPRLAETTNDGDGSYGVEIHFGLRRGKVTFQYIILRGDERVTPHRATTLASH